MNYGHSCAFAPIAAVEACLENSPSSLYFFVLLQFLQPRGCLEACFEACRQAHPERLLVLLQVRIVETCRSCFAAISRAEACLDSLLLALHSAGDLEACLEACFIFILYTYICFAAISTASPCFTPASRYALGL